MLYEVITLRELAPMIAEGTGFVLDESIWDIKVWNKSEVISLASEKKKEVGDTYMAYKSSYNFV